MLAAVADFSITLSERERDILYSRVVPDRRTATLDALAKKYGVTRERIRQLELKVESRLRRCLGLKTREQLKAESVHA